ncbi:MAG: cysteine desulfurase [Tyzzerella sp.]|nr:cysteine desulfurase [Tyzzerella sp.]
MVYADNAATTKLDLDAFEAMKPYFLEEYGNASQPYSFSRTARRAIKEARKIIASCINAKPEEIFFTSGGTESDNWAIKGSAFSDVYMRTIITSAIEHHAVLNACKSLARLRYPVEYLSPKNDGVITPEILSDIITDETRLVSVMLANNEIGTIQPIRALAELAHSHGALFHTDAVQCLGHIPIDVKELGVDMLSASAHKFNGPKGVGFLYIKEGTHIVPYSDGGAQEFGLRAGTENVAGIVGMSIALKKNCEQIVTNTKHLEKLEKILITNLDVAGIDYIRNGSTTHVPGNISLSFRGGDGEAILHRLDLMAICVSTGSACDSVNTQISHVLQAIGLDENYARGTIRISFGKDNSVEDAHKIVQALLKILK